MALKTTPYDPAEYLGEDDAIAAHIDDALATEDPAFIAKCIGDVARARGMTQVANDSGLSRESLYKALSPDGNPEFATILKVINALGLKFAVTQMETAQNPA